MQRQIEMVAEATGDDDWMTIVSALELQPVLRRVCGEIAYGTQRSVDLALALLGRPKVVLLDEPCAGLVADESRQLLDHVRTLSRERSVAVLLVEHDVDGVFRTCDRITVIDLGCKLVCGDPADVRKDSRVITAYLGSEA